MILLVRGRVGVYRGGHAGYVVGYRHARRPVLPPATRYGTGRSVTDIIDQFGPVYGQIWTIIDQFGPVYRDLGVIDQGLCSGLHRARPSSGGTDRR